LLGIATRLETDDNIAVAFVPDAQGAKSLRYRLHVGLSTEHEPPAATARATRIARTERGTRFIVDFRGSEPKPGAAALATDLVLTAAGATVLEQHIEPHGRISGHRASFELEPSVKQKDVELRAFLRRGPDAVSETWSYLWQPTP
jgi:glucans biosynthesis protein